MSPRTGRPKSENPQKYRIALRIDEITLNKLAAYAKKYNITKADVLRKGLNSILDSE